MFTLKSVKGVFMDIRNFNNTNDINDFIEQVSNEQLSSEEQSKFEDLKGKYVRVAIKGWGHSVKIIGNILEDKWFDIETFFADKGE